MYTAVYLPLLPFRGIHLWRGYNSSLSAATHNISGKDTFMLILIYKNSSHYIPIIWTSFDSHNCIFENNSLKALFGQNIKKLKILKLSPDSRYLQKLALKMETFCGTDISAVYLPLLPSRGMHLWKGIVSYHPIRKEQTAWLLASREIKTHVYAKWQMNEFVPRDQISPLIVVYCLLLLLKNK